MDVEILALCDAATESGNKINILGIFDEVKGEAEPLRVHCSIGGRVRFDRAEAGRKQVNLRIRDDAGTEVFVATSEVEVSVKPNGVVAMQFALALPILILPHFGRYAVDLLIDNQVAKSIPLLATQLGQPGTGPQPQMVPPP